MASLSSDPRNNTFAQNEFNFSEIFATVQQLSSRIDENRMQQVVDAAKGLMTEDKQLIVDFLSMSLEKYHHLLMDPGPVLSLLTQITSSANVVARNRTLDREHLTPDSNMSPGTYIVRGGLPSRVRVIQRGERKNLEAFSRELVTWAHLSHPNILPVYWIFLDGELGPVSLVSPFSDTRNIVDHAKTLPQAERVPLISDVIEGLSYLHQLDIVHGGLNPESVIIGDSGHALLSDLDASSGTFAIRYLAPELFEDEDADRTKASDVWALGCLCYEVLSGNIPFCQVRKEALVGTAVAAGKQPARPGPQGVKGEKINDVIWRTVSACWEFESEHRPSCSKLHDAFASMDIHKDRPVPKTSVLSAILGTIDTLSTDLEKTKSLLNQILGSDQLLPPPSRIPEHLHERLTGLADSIPRAEALAVAAKKLNHNDTQLLLDVLDLVLEESPSAVNFYDPVVNLLTKLMVATRIYPQRYKINRIRYDPSSIVEGNFGNVYRGNDLDINVNMVTDASDVANIIALLVLSVHSSHPNVLPFYGIFNEVVNEIPRFCIVSPYMKNGTLQDYAPRLSQRFRIPLINDVILGLHYIHDKFEMVHNNLRPDTILVSDEGRALLTFFNTSHILPFTTATKATLSSAIHWHRFESPELASAGKGSYESDIWFFGCLCYQVLSKKLPYYQYTGDDQIKSALSRGEAPRRPRSTENEIEMISDELWELIIGCCKSEPGDRLTFFEIQELLTNLRFQDDRTNTQKFPTSAIVSLRKRPDADWERVKHLLDQIQVELLRSPLSKLIQNHIKDVAAEIGQLEQTDVQTLVDFLDATLKNHLTISDERNRVLALLSRSMTLTQVFPKRHELKGIRYHPKPIAEGGFGKVHQGLSDPGLCIKVTTRVHDDRALITYIKELILWAHSSHPNILPFYGTFFDDSQRICLVSPYMTKGNLRDYAPQLPQKSRIPLLLDTIIGLNYLHGLGIVHTDLKGENVLISDEGRGLITDFGASHIITATAGGATSAAVMSTLRFTAPEVIQDQTRRMRPTMECDIWSFGCLFYEALSRKLPYYEYQLDAQVLAALLRGQLPKRPGLTHIDINNEEDWDYDSDEKDWDDLDDTIWNLITKCLVPKPEGRPSASRIQELIIDMGAYNSRTVAKDMPGVEILKQKPNVEINLNHARALLDHLRILFLVRRIFKSSNEDLVTAIAKLESNNASVLTYLWALALNHHLSVIDDRSRLLAIYSVVAGFRGKFQAGYSFRTRPQYHSMVIAEGSFGKIYRGSEPNTCVQIVDFSQMNPGLKAQWLKSVVPWAHSSHPNILPFFGLLIGGGRGYLISPFVDSGNLHNYAPSLALKSRILLILDVIEALLYLHKLGIIHGNLKTQNVLVSDEGRGLITDFRPYHVSVAAAENAPTASFITSTLRFTAPELVKDSQMLPTTASDVWSVGGLLYEVLSRKVPYYTYTEDSEIRSALSRAELPTRPTAPDSDTDEIDDHSWDLITKCCAATPGSRPKLMEIQAWLQRLGVEDNRPAARPLPGAEILKQRQAFWDVDIDRVEEILDELQTHLPNISQEEVKDDQDQD